MYSADSHHPSIRSGPAGLLVYNVTPATALGTGHQRRSAYKLCADSTCPDTGRHNVEYALAARQVTPGFQLTGELLSLPSGLQVPFHQALPAAPWRTDAPQPSPISVHLRQNPLEGKSGGKRKLEFTPGPQGPDEKEGLRQTLASKGRGNQPQTPGATGMPKGLPWNPPLFPQGSE